MKSPLRLLAALAITGVALWWTFKDVVWVQFAASLRGANWLVLVPYLGILTFVHFARTLRWGNLMSGIEVVPFRKLNSAAAIGFMILMILPFRLGEFARPFLIAQRSGIRRSAAMASVVFERVVDGIAIAVMLQVLLYIVPGDPRVLAAIRVGATVMFCVFGGGLLLLLIARWKHALVLVTLHRTVGRFAPKLNEKVVDIVEGFLAALRQLPNASNMAQFFVWTAFYWFANGVGVTILANAFDCTGGAVAQCQVLHISLLEGFAILAVSVVGMMIPAGPASTGTMQSFVKLGLSAFVDRDVVLGSGVAFANVMWILQVAQQIVFGLVALAVSHISIRELTGSIRQERRDEMSERENATP